MMKTWITVKWTPIVFKFVYRTIVKKKKKNCLYLPENTKTIRLQILKVQNCFIDNNDKNPKEAIQ
jgi:hypothetical protein